jgi:O-antigen/teichoic acid export membrane protein
VLGFLLSLWMAKTLPIDEYGTWGLVYAFQTGLATFGAVGILEAVVSLLRLHPGPEERSKLFAAANGAFLLTAGTSLAAAALVRVVFVTRSDIGVVTLSSAIVSGAVLAFSSLQAQIVRLEERHLSSLSYYFLVPLAGLVGSIAAFSMDRSVGAFFVGSAAGLMMAAPAFLFKQVGPSSPSRDRSVHGQILARLKPYVAVAFFGWLSGYGNNFVVDYLFESSDVARFTFALAIGSVMQLVASALNQVWGPRFFRITQVQSLEIVENKNRRFFATQSMVLGGLGAVCLISLPPLLRAVGGNLASYASMGLEFFFVLAGYVFLSPWSHCHNYLLAYDKGRNVMHIVLITSAIGIVLWFALMWWLGPLGIYVGFFSQMVIRSLGIVLFTQGIWPVTIGWGSVGAGVLMTLGGLVVSRL